MGIFGLLSGKVSLADCGALQGATDSHSHILFGVDDGIKTLEESLEALAAEEAMGVAAVWCTPHVMEDVPNATERLRDVFSALRSAYSGNMTLHLAAEYMMDTVLAERLETGDLLTMGDGLVLVETSALTPPFDFFNTLRELQKKGYNPLLAHPERYRYMGEADYEELVKMGVRFQLNLPSIAGYYGKTAQQKASWLLEQEMYSAVGTDCHKAKALGEPYTRALISKKQGQLLKKILSPAAR